MALVVETASLEPDPPLLTLGEGVKRNRRCLKRGQYTER